MPLHGLTVHTVLPSSALPAAGTHAFRGITALSPTEWMVSDVATAVGSSSAIIGFIQFSAGRYEVTRIGGATIEFSSFLSLCDAIAALTAKPLQVLTLAPAPR